MVWSMAVLRVRIEPGIPKLLVKINPQEAEQFGAKNLGEVTLRKVSGLRGQVAVLHLSRNVPRGEVLMSIKLADLLDVEDDETVEVACSQAGGHGGAPGAPPAPAASLAGCGGGGWAKGPGAAAPGQAEWARSSFTPGPTPREAPAGAPAACRFRDSQHQAFQQAMGKPRQGFPLQHPQQPRQASQPQQQPPSQQQQQQRQPQEQLPQQQPLPQQLPQQQPQPPPLPDGTLQRMSGGRKQALK